MIQYLTLLRPWHWVKNFFVFLPIFFAGELFSTNKFLSTSYVFLIFCCVASCVYIINDIFDRKTDALHPLKKNRPIASGQISSKQALLFLVFLLIFNGLLIYFLAPQIAWIIIIYFLLNILYSITLKHHPIFDLLTISIFYLLRVLGGAVILNLTVSRWLVLCTIFMTLFLIIAKRKAELSHLHQRNVLQSYNPQLLDNLLSISMALTLVAYGLYTVLGNKSDWAVYSILFVILGLFRYLFLSFDSNKTEYSEKIIFSDAVILFSIISWVIFMYLVIYVV